MSKFYSKQVLVRNGRWAIATGTVKEFYHGVLGPCQEDTLFKIKQTKDGEELIWGVQSREGRRGSAGKDGMAGGIRVTLECKDSPELVPIVLHNRNKAKDMLPYSMEILELGKKTKTQVAEESEEASEGSIVDEILESLEDSDSDDNSTAEFLNSIFGESEHSSGRKSRKKVQKVQTPEEKFEDLLQLLNSEDFTMEMRNTLVNRLLFNSAQELTQVSPVVTPEPTSETTSTEQVLAA